MSDLTSRLRFQDSASMDDFYTLLSFNQRAAVFAMRERRSEHVINGLTAIAMIEKKRVDFRDVLRTLGLLYHAVGVVGGNVEDLFGKASAIAEPRMSDLIQGFLKRSEDYRDIRKSAGYTVIETQAGPRICRLGV